MRRVITELPVSPQCRSAIEADVFDEDLLSRWTRATVTLYRRDAPPIALCDDVMDEILEPALYLVGQADRGELEPFEADARPMPLLFSIMAYESEMGRYLPDFPEALGRRALWETRDVLTYLYQKDGYARLDIGRFCRPIYEEHTEDELEREFQSFVAAYTPCLVWNMDAKAVSEWLRLLLELWERVVD